jgi:hypothetical protein
MRHGDRSRRAVSAVLEAVHGDYSLRDDLEVQCCRQAEDRKVGLP